MGADQRRLRAQRYPRRRGGGGTLRCLDDEAWHAAPDVVKELLDSVVAAYGVQAELDYRRGVPPTINEPNSVEIFRAACVQVLGEQAVAATPQSLGGEDFAWYLETTPGAYARLGTHWGIPTVPCSTCIAARSTWTRPRSGWGHGSWSPPRWPRSAPSSAAAWTTPLKRTDQGGRAPQYARVRRGSGGKLISMDAKPTLEQIRRAPKVLLHDHLDGGLRPQTIVELADAAGYTDLPTDDPEELGAWFVAAANSGSLERYLETFRHTVAVMQTREALERVAAECVEDLAADGIVYAEVRYAPEQHLRGGLRLEEVVEAVQAGFAEESGGWRTAAR